MNERLRIAGALKPLPLYKDNAKASHYSNGFSLLHAILDCRSCHSEKAQEQSESRQICAGIQADQMLGKNRKCHIHLMRCSKSYTFNDYLSLLFSCDALSFFPFSFFLFLLLLLHAYHKNYARWWQKTSLVTPFDSNKVSQQLRSVIITAKAQKIVQLHVNKCTWCTQTCTHTHLYSQHERNLISYCL